MKKECICIKSHFRVPHRSIRYEKLKEGISISNKRVYIKKGSIHTLTQKENHFGRIFSIKIDELFVYDSGLYFDTFYSADPKVIRKEKLKRINTSAENINLI